MNDYTVTIKVHCVPAKNEEQAKDIAMVVLMNGAVEEEGNLTFTVEKQGEWL